MVRFDVREALEKFGSTSDMNINSDFGHYIRVEQPIADIAAKAVCMNAESPRDALLLLDMLGLIPPQPGYEVKTIKESQKEDAKRQRDEEKARKLES